jgi:hypothetical protein
MANSDVLPYFVPSIQSWKTPEWQIRTLDEWTDLPEWIEGWDPDTDLLLRMVGEVDADRIRAECHLPPRASLILTVSWISSSSLMTGTILSRELLSSPSIVEVELPAKEIGGTVTIITTVSVRDDNDLASPGAARFAGSILLRHETRVAVEGAGAMFPVAIVDFATTPFDTSSSWKLEVTEDLEAPFLGGFQLLLNSRDVDLVKAVTSGATDPRSILLVEDLEAGVASLLTELALGLRDELTAASEWQPDSVGNVLTRFLDGAKSTGLDTIPYGAEATAAFRSKLNGVVRALSMGRAFA